MFILLFSFILIILYTLIEIVDAFIFPVKYCIDKEGDIDEIDFIYHVPYNK